MSQLHFLLEDLITLMENAKRIGVASVRIHDIEVVVTNVGATATTDTIGFAIETKEETEHVL